MSTASLRAVALGRCLLSSCMSDNILCFPQKGRDRGPLLARVVFEDAQLEITVTDGFAAYCSSCKFGRSLKEVLN